MVYVFCFTLNSGLSLNAIIFIEFHIAVLLRPHGSTTFLYPPLDNSKCNTVSVILNYSKLMFSLHSPRMYRWNVLEEIKCSSMSSLSFILNSNTTWVGKAMFSLTELRGGITNQIFGRP